MKSIINYVVPIEPINRNRFTQHAVDSGRVSIQLRIPRTLNRNVSSNARVRWELVSPYCPLVRGCPQPSNNSTADWHPSINWLERVGLSGRTLTAFCVCCCAKYIYTQTCTNGKWLSISQCTVSCTARTFVVELLWLWQWVAFHMLPARRIDGCRTSCRLKKCQTIDRLRIGPMEGWKLALWETRTKAGRSKASRAMKLGNEYHYTNIFVCVFVCYHTTFSAR